MTTESILSIKGSIVPHPDRLNDKLRLELSCEDAVEARLLGGLDDAARREVQRKVSAVYMDAMLGISRIIRSAS